MQTRATRLAVAVAAAATFAAATPPGVAAQGGGSGSLPAAGDWSVMFTAFEPDVVTNLGLYRMITDRANLGLELDLNWSDGEQRIDDPSGLVIRSEGTTWEFAVGPSLRWYGDRMGPVSPYLRSKITVGWGSTHLDVNDNRQNESDIRTVSASLGVGAEWYPIRWMGIGGHTGLVWSRSNTNSTNNNSGSEAETSTANLRTFRSGLVVNFYFR